MKLLSDSTEIIIVSPDDGSIDGFRNAVCSLTDSQKNDKYPLYFSIKNK
jgi:hypothetical protein